MAPQEAGIAMPMTAECHHDLAVTTIKEGLHKEEKQIAVDPLSLKEAVIPLEATSLPPPLPPPKSKFLSISQSNSATSSPRFASFLSRKKPIQSLESPPRQVLQQINLQKSKSCGEGRSRALAEEFDLWLVKRDNRNQYHHGSFSKTEAIEDSPKQSTRNRKHVEAPKGFKCSCLYLPGFGKAKPVRAKKEGSTSTIDAVNVISRTVSMEKFECGSWASSPRAIIVPEMEGNHDSMSSYFDLPSELIKCGGGEDNAHSPVTAAIVFKKDTKGALKNGSNRGRKSDTSPRHVRFSTSSSPVSAASSCITPRLRRAREEFNAFLEVQRA